MAVTFVIWIKFWKPLSSECNRSGYSVSAWFKTLPASSNPTFLGLAMQSKTGNLMLALGAVIAVIGLSIMPAGLGPNIADKNLVGVGAAIFCDGCVGRGDGRLHQIKSTAINRAKNS